MFVLAALPGSIFIALQVDEIVNQSFGGMRPRNGLMHFTGEGKKLLYNLKWKSQPYHNNDGDDALDVDVIYTSSDQYVVRIRKCDGVAFDDEGKQYMRAGEDLEKFDKKLIYAFDPSGNGVDPPNKRCIYAEPNSYDQYVPPK